MKNKRERDQRDQRILRERAEALAKERLEDDFDYWSIEVVEFLLAEERYALPTSVIKEVLPLKGLTPLPYTPPFILGIISVRGEIFSVMDFRIFFHLPEKSSSKTHVILLKSDDLELGIAVDTILGTSSIPLYQVQAPPSTWSGIRRDFLQGLVHGELIILDGERFLKSKALVVKEETT